MARDFATVNLALWGDDDFLDLTGDEQRLFLLLWTSPTLSYCGGGDWHPGRIAALATDWDRARVEHAAAGLSRALFLLIDPDTEEYLLRSWIKHDGLWRNPKMIVSLANARAELSSRALRGVVVHEVLKLKESAPELTAWTRPAVVSMLDQRAVDPSTLEPFNPPSNPTVNPTANPPSNPTVKGYATPSANPSSNPSPTPTPTPEPTPAPLGELALIDDTATATAAAPRSKTGHRLDDDWTPARTDGNLKAEQGRSPDWLTDQLERFRNYWIAKPGKDGVKLDWDRTWQNWLKRAAEWDRGSGRPRTAAAMSENDWVVHMRNAIAADERDAS